MLTAAAPWLDRRARRAGWALMLGLVVTAFVDSPMSFNALLAAATGWLAGAAVLVAAGTPSAGRALHAVIDGLAAVGVALRQLDRAGVDARGSTPYFGVEADGSKLFVKALGADERSADLLFRLYRRILPRDFGDQQAFLSLQRAVEHEALRRPRRAVPSGSARPACGPSPRPSRTATSSPMKRSMASPSTESIRASDRCRARRDLAPRG